MRPEQICTGMTHALERMVFQDVRARSPFAASFYPSPATNIQHSDIQPIRAIIPADTEVDGALVTISGIMGLSENVARDQILMVCRETLEDEGFPYAYLGENPESLRSELMRLGYMCYLVGFEAGSPDQCAIFGEIVDTSIDQLAQSTLFKSLDRSQLLNNKLIAGSYFTQMMIEGAQASEFHKVGRS